MTPSALAFPVSVETISFNMKPSISSNSGSLFSRLSTRFSINLKPSVTLWPNPFTGPLLLEGVGQSPCNRAVVDGLELPVKVVGEVLVVKSPNDVPGPDSRGSDGESISISVFITGKGGLSGFSRSKYMLRYFPLSLSF